MVRTQICAGSRDHERGAVAIIMAIAIAMLAGFGALSVDLAHARYARLQLQNASDAAAHAALLRLRSTGNRTLAKEAAKTVAAQHRVGGKPFVLNDDDIELGGWDFTRRSFTPGVSPANAVRILGTRSSARGANGGLATTFGRVLGRSAIDLSHTGTAAYRIRTIVVAQDITGSFAGSIDESARGDVAMLDELYARAIPADRIGMQVFTGASTLFTALSSVQSSYAAIRAQWHGDGKSAFDSSKQSGITVCHKLDLNPLSPAPFNHRWVPPCSSGGDGTNPGAALRAAREQLLASTRAYETRVIVLITDGRPACCTLINGAVSCNETDSCAQQRAAYGVEMANAAAQAGIHVFTVSLGANPSQTEYVASLARGIGTSYDTPNATELSAILARIAGTIPIALVQ